MERVHVSEENMLPGYDTLQLNRAFWTPNKPGYERRPNLFYEAYNNIHKVYVGEKGANYLLKIHEVLRTENSPDYLDAAGWAAAEAALVQESRSSIDRLRLVESAERCWESALDIQDSVDAIIPEDYIETDLKYRFALNLAFAPIMKAMIAGNVTDSVRECVFADVLAIAQLAGVQRSLAEKDCSVDGIGQLLGFEHECNALLALLHTNDPRFIPLPSSARAGSGVRYPNQTHDIVLLNQHWGKIRKVIPIEIKAKASLSDLQRYDALIVRGKMHLAVMGKHSPEHTRNAFQAYYEGESTLDSNKIVYQVTSTIKRLLMLYQQGGRSSVYDSPTIYHDISYLQKKHPEFLLNRPQKY